MSMLPRLKPREYYDSSSRSRSYGPGPIQGAMVHPICVGREGKSGGISFRGRAQVLQKTKGVPLFQEQAMKVAIVGAVFRPRGGRAQALDGDLQVDRRREKVHDKLVEGMIAMAIRAISPSGRSSRSRASAATAFASNAASFAKIAYALPG